VSGYKQLTNTNYPFHKDRRCEGRGCYGNATVITEPVHIEDIGIVSFELCVKCNENFRKLKYSEQNNSNDKINILHDYNYQNLYLDNKSSENGAAIKKHIVMGGIA
jgi:hypothetical protein